MVANGEQRTGMTVALVVALLIYHFTGMVLPGRESSFYQILQYAQLAVTVAGYYLLVANSAFVQLILGSQYVAGNYEGESRHFLPTDNAVSAANSRHHVERFSIKQNLFEIEISGQSFDKIDLTLASTWFGRAYRWEGNNLFFGLELNVETVEYGILTLRFSGDSVVGFYYSGSTEAYNVFRVEATRRRDRDSWLRKLIAQLRN